LEFKNALLETFPHLQGKLGGPGGTSPLLQQSPRGGTSSTRTSTSTLRGGDPDHNDGGQDSPRVGGAAGGGVHRGPVRTDHISDDTPGSWNATLPRGPKAGRVRKSPEGSSNVVDSGFSTEAKDVSGASTLGSPSVGPAGKSTMLGNHPLALDVRWDTWENGVPGVSAIPATSSCPSDSAEDELFYLLDVIHRKTVRLRKDIEAKVGKIIQNTAL
jgi:hypothetical protein